MTQTATETPSNKSVSKKTNRKKV
ncbi:hypothetical protein CGSHiR3021_11354 [Haemophilus influenzae 22.4-21]|uniref:Uncharacterized protein n=1 Tax=Haemophilus influenzae 22.4-21 TaxID=375063 RepID=A4NZZ9_HAEIF|nr:hypothetical protein CGSHiR3021_11354 [Haemophilus influenzae 22.4-21]